MWKKNPNNSHCLRNLQTTAQSKQSPNRQKFARSGHPGCGHFIKQGVLPSFFAVQPSGIFSQVLRLTEWVLPFASKFPDQPAKTERNIPNGHKMPWVMV
jgi:hypothetical protein